MIPVALWLALAAGPGFANDGKIAIAAHRADRTYVYIASVDDLAPDARRRLLEPALPEALPADAGVDGRTVVATFQPVGSPFARWAGRRLQGFKGASQVCVKALQKLVLLGATAGEGDPTPEAMARALASGIVAGEVGDADGACRTADWFHDPDVGPIPVADATTVESSSPAGRDEILGGIGRLRLQPAWVENQNRHLAAKPTPKVVVGVPEPDAGSYPASWDGAGARGVHFALGQSPFVAAASTSPDCAEHLALLFHAMNKPILIWPYLSFDSPAGALPSWVADVGGLWPVAFLDGTLLAPDGDHYLVVQRFPGTPAAACPKP